TYFILVMRSVCILSSFFFFFQAEDGIRDFHVTGVQTCALPISDGSPLIDDEATGVERNALRIHPHAVQPRALVPRHQVHRPAPRSEERRVGKECRPQWSPDPCKKNNDEQGCRSDRDSSRRYDTA